MSGKAGPSEGASLEGDRSQHGNAMAEGVGTAFSWLTIVPVRGATVFDRITGRRALTAAPLTGLVPGLGAVLVAWAVTGLAWLFGGGAGTGLPSWVRGLDDAGQSAASPSVLGPAGDPAGAIGFGSDAGSAEAAAKAAAVAAATSPLTAVLAGVLAVCVAELLTRAMHVDGLADVADALGSYRDPEGAREILRAPDTGPMGSAAVTLTLVAQAAAMSILVHGFATALFPAPWILGASIDPVRVGAAAAVIVVPFIIGRAVATTGCHRSLPPMSPTGFGGLVAATQSTWVLVAWWVPLAIVAGVLAGIGGVLACIAAVVFAFGFGRMAVRRLGGVNGDVLGAMVQLTTLIAAVLLALS
ncbi:adenosylcobinamide-GDP ribazoletransferase [Corynebacterium freneyi]|uniref:adenosylcobinamide-GDP ribazoletransferase n=1 Tax=Corynebacterium freneyi TaxID=134034 RepID=UPI00254BE3D0|nr:adenosylcobinamide-GDP ribazoletransferase [Corynebacterium freneyi]MDK8768364.1 adenosylcobinamide-GDP ribazoletransferase [Corynebacterium freneyi]